MNGDTPSILSVDRFLDRIDDTLRLTHVVSPFTLILGAGFSHGVIPTSREIVSAIPEWLRDQRNDAKGSHEFARDFWATVNDELSTDSKIELDAAGRPSLATGDQVSTAYCAAMLQGLGSPYLRRAYFRHVCSQSGGKVNLAHLYLASILHAQESTEWKERGYQRFCTTLFTTNFDPLLQIALQSVSKLYYMTDRPQTLETPYDDDHDAIHLIYTHGSIHQAALANTEQEIKDCAKAQAARLPDYFKRHGVIVIGYSGWNDACMEGLTRCEQFDHNLYWCDRHPPEELKTRLRANVYEFLASHRDNAHYVSIEGADILMQKLHERLLGTTEPSMIRDPLPPLLDRIRQIRVPETIGKRSHGIGGDIDRPKMVGFADVIGPVITRLANAIRLWNEGRLDSLELHPTEATEHGETLIGDKLRQAYYLYAAGRFDDAAQLLTDVVDDRSAAAAERAMALLGRGVAKGQQGDFTGELADYDEAIKMEEVPPEQRAMVYFNRGVTRGQLGDVAGAMADYDAVVGMKDVPSRQRAMALVNRGGTRGQQDDIAGALADFDTVIAMRDAPAEQRAIAFVNRGVAKGQQGDVAGRLADYDAVIAMEDAPVEQRAQALVNRGVTRGQQGDVAGKLADYDAVIAMEDAPAEQRAMALVNRGVARGQQGDVAGELADYDAVIAMEDAPTEQRAQSLLYRGVTRGKQGDIAGAIADFTRVIEMEDASVNARALALLNRGNAKGKQNDTAGELTDYSAAIDMDDVPAEALVDALGARAWAYYRQGEYNKSIQDSRQALTLDSSKSWIRANLGLALLHVGQVDEARQAYEQAIGEMDDVETIDKNVVTDLKEALEKQPDLSEASEILAMAEQRKAGLRAQG